jgi:hypothetical protein
VVARNRRHASVARAHIASVVIFWQWRVPEAVLISMNLVSRWKHCVWRCKSGIGVK